eukprot:scaffold660420_cov46-Prasinocladus_malaysianus.AAC.1
MFYFSLRGALVLFKPVKPSGLQLNIHFDADNVSAQPDQSGFGPRRLGYLMAPYQADPDLTRLRTLSKATGRDQRQSSARAKKRSHTQAQGLCA